LVILSAGFLFALAAFGDECACEPETQASASIRRAISPLLGSVPYETVAEHPWLVDTLQHQETCETDWSQLGCPHAVTNFEPLETPESGFLAKVEMLLGQKPPIDFIKNGDPYAELDFSKAPKLKAVYLSSLVFRADFYGTVMARLLKYHAEHGALVNVVTTDYMMLKKDRALLEPIAAQNKNFKLDEFRYHNPHGIVSKAKNFITDKYRDMHVKLFITLSDEKEADNAVIFGGRNIHDGFLFREAPDHSRFPELVQYGKGKDDNFVHWNDFEAKVTSKELANSAAAQLQSFISRDKNTQVMRPFSVNGRSAATAREGTFQPFISIPYVDGHALEKQYVHMIDAAKTSIKISSPYLRPTPAIMAALKRATKKGVDVQIQTRVELAGDTQAWLYEEVNKESINALEGQTKIFKWKENSILHSKFLLIDGKKSVIGSVNLSRRSFIQDVENGFIINDTGVTKDMEKIFDSYVKKSERVTEPLPRKIAPTLVIDAADNQF
jgi:phosphatidylserine/phosphatidylglycerophosphate/cardiolipin synthase-like enzyme